MKVYTIKLDEVHLKQAFVPLRSKRHVIVLLINTVKLFVQRHSLAPRNPVIEVVLYVDKCSRLFFNMNGKYFSLNFPFEVKETGEELSFSSNGVVLDSVLTSQLLRLFSGGSYEAECETSFIDAVWESGEGVDYFWPLVQKLMTFEDSYLRYDCDPQRAKGKLHPHYHIDVFYTNSSFKMGIACEIDSLSFRDLLDLGTDCHYLDTS